MIVMLGLLAASALQLARFGPYQNIVVDHHGDEATVSAYGDAHVVHLRGSQQQVSGCIAGIPSGKATHWRFRTPARWWYNRSVKAATRSYFLTRCRSTSSTSSSMRAASTMHWRR